MSKQYLSCAETAKLVRLVLKESFPGIKFSVKSSVYSGGASINVSYVDGPSAEEVKSVISVFEGSYFDGMTDYKGNNYGSLDGQEVSFGADFIFVNRKFTVGYLEKLVDQAAAELGFAKPKVVESYFGAQLESVDYNEERRLMAKIWECSATKAQESQTLKRVGFLGDDGYGYGSVGRLAA